jgi:Ni/Co efflux regulator RcnB
MPKAVCRFLCFEIKDRKTYLAFTFIAVPLLNKQKNRETEKKRNRETEKQRHKEIDRERDKGSKTVKQKET